MPPPPGGYYPQWGPYGYQVPRPGCVPLRPLSLSDILDGSFRVIRRNPRATLGVSAAIAVVQSAVLLIFQLITWGSLGSTRTDSGTEQLTGAQVGGVATSAFSVVVLSAVFGALLTGMLTLVVTDDVLGNRVPIDQLWRRVRPRLLPLIGLSVVITVVEALGLVLCLGPGIWLWGIWAVAVPAFMVDGTSVFGALGRSRELVRDYFWRVWGIRALGTLIVLVVGGIVGVPFTLLAVLLSGDTFSSVSHHAGGAPVVYLLVSAIGGILTTTFTAPVKSGIDALLYVDQRMRKEGLDIALQQAVTQRAMPPMPPMPPTPPMPPMPPGPPASGWTG